MTDDKLTVPELQKRLDVLIRVVRYKGSPDKKQNLCVTCHRFFPIQELQAGHFIKRGDLVLKYDETNIYAQCRRCNHYLDGAQDKMAYWIVETYGARELRRLVETDFKWLAGELPKPKREDYVKAYNYWLRENKNIERHLEIKLIPENWKETT